MAVSITISSPLAGSTVDRPFPANGTYTGVSSSITVVLKDSSGTVVATGNPVNASNGKWDTTLSPTQGYTGASVVAALTGTTASATENNITVT